MTRYKYKVVSAAGEILEGEVDAPDRQAAIDGLRGQGHVPIRAEPATGRSGLRLAPAGPSRTRRVSPEFVAMTTRELATLLQAGLPMDRALSVLAEISKDAAARALLADVLKSIRGGSSLADALTAHRESLPAYYIGLVRAGEAGGTLDGVLARLAETLERAQALRETMLSAMYYPAFVLIMSALTLVVLFTLVIPEFRPLFEDSATPMPDSMAAVIALSDGLRDYWWAIALIAAAIVLAVRQHDRTPQGRDRRDRWVLRLPLAGELVTKVEVARFARTLGTLLANGVMVLTAVSITAETISNRRIAQAIGGLANRLKRGEGLATPLLETGLFPPLAVQLVRVGEESGQLEKMLLRVADIYDEEVKRTLQRMLSLLVPVLTICIGILVGAIIATMLTAILSTYDLAL
ncbi:MAG: type II secretion system F family protein [Dongiaceae bacterium]